ncbi:DUF1835 domain-containing protein [Mesoflavibacter profundi]|uniref:DUF1835 domain-containing protein n=1 Tax=Mesoflavibacter profundi TaxID=2708110 RepID=A0ABT4RXN6_9FLAO|nr:DUF1835 domain-containing protein [Mesoflavibacter profundi]MDA0176580.1 DUF1835 domain-containing protein [Mesoflavibacter profundi]
MTNKAFHITNGGVLTDYLTKLNFDGLLMTWHEMLCVGPTTKQIDNDNFFSIRKQFIESTYNIPYKTEVFKTELDKINELNNYDHVVLWFEFDLFCHINMIAAISWLKQHKCSLPIYLVNCGKIKGEKQLKGFGELTEQQIKTHYNNKTLLNVDDIAFAQKAWRIYCEEDHNQLKELIVRPSNFLYMSNCLKAHMKRFPDTRSGLNMMEYNLLKIIKEYQIKDKHHLLGYGLHYQGYYGYGDIQIKRIINNLQPFYDQTEDGLILSRQGFLALAHQKNFLKEMASNFQFGGAKKTDFQYLKTESKLVKTI